MGTTVFARGVLPLVPIIVCVLTVTTARADEPAMSLPQAIEYSLRNNGELKALRIEKDIRDAARIRAGLLPNPTLDLEAGTGALTGSKSENSLAIGLSQEFLLAGKRDKRLAIAERELNIYRWQLANQERLLRDEVKTAFYEAVLARERLALIDRSIALNRQLLEVTKERLTAGDIPELEMNLVKVELARSEGNRIEVAKAMLQSRARLGTLMGLLPGSQPAIEGQLEPGVPVTKSLADLRQLAHANRPDLKVLEAEKGWGDAEIQLAQAESVPNLTTALVFKRDTTSMEIGDAERKDTAYTIGVRFSIPIPVFDRNQAGVQEARAKKNSSETRLAAAAGTVEREAETAYASYQNAMSVLALYRADIIPQLEENLQLTREAYRLGEVSILSVIQEQKKFFEVNDGYLNALHDRQAALVKLESVTASEFTGGDK
ncbi:TolC family protein [Geobacter sp. FeAm09]|uniref:TolC family protein n=1 Tax=Geobacter sp. FeAm09 TaxID=2597769 RepID=UPI0011EE6453|nr:TolC family protein [Geobacter sp. FeAm09]QEM68862.1 TolC family protein [Geobacter sp. FeAm09]